MGKQVKGWVPPEDAVTDVQSTSTEPAWTPPADAVPDEPVKKKESSDQGGFDFAEQQRKQFEQPGQPSEKSTPKNTDSNNWRGISEAAKSASPIVGAVIDFGRKIASGFADELPQAVAQGVEVAKSSVNPATAKEFIERVPVDFQKYVREKEGLKWYEPFDQSKYVDKYADSFMEETGRADIAKNIEKNNPEILARRKEVEAYVQSQKSEGAEKMAGATQSYKDVKDLKSLASYIGTLGGNAAYQIPLSVLTKGGSSLLQESATIYDQQLENISKEKGISRQEVIAQGLDKPAEGQAYALLAATLDKVSAGNILKAFKSGGGQMVKKWVSSAVPEAVTEPAQGVLEDVGAGGDLSEALTSGKRIDEVLGGFVGGSMGVLGPTKTEAVEQVRQNVDKFDNKSTDAAAENIEAALNQSDNLQEIIDKNEGELQSEPNTGGLPEVVDTVEQTAGAYTDAVVQDGPVSSEEQTETVQQKAERELNELVERGAISREGNNVTILTEEGGREAKRIYDELHDVDQKSGEIVPRKETDDETEVTQNSGFPSQLYKDLKQITGDKDVAKSEYDAILDDGGEFKKRHGDWENRIMKEFRGAGNKYSVKRGAPENADPNSFAWTNNDADGNPQIVFNDKKVRREEDFSAVKSEYATEVKKSESPEYTALYDKVVTKLRDLKLHLIHQELIRKQKGEVTTEDNIKSLKEIERINDIPLAKDYYGQPMIFMHAGSSGIEQFKKPGEKGYVQSDIMTGSAGIYFSKSKKGGKYYSEFGKNEENKPAKGKDIYYVFLKTKNPYYMTDPRARADYKLESSETISKKDVEALKAKGYDSVIWDKESDPKHEVVVFEPDQVEIIGSYNKGLTKSNGEKSKTSGTRDQGGQESVSVEQRNDVSGSPSGATTSSKSTETQRSESDNSGSQSTTEESDDTGRAENDPRNADVDKTRETTETKEDKGPVLPEQSTGKKTLAIAKRILDSDADAEIKRGVKQKGAEYVPKGINITDQEAKNLLDLYGHERAETLVRDQGNGITGDTRTALAARLYESYKQTADQSTDPETKRINYEKAVDIALTSAEQLKEAGRQANAAKIWKSITSSEDMTVMAIEKEVERQGGKMLETIYKQVKRSRQQIDSEIERIISERVTQGVEAQLKRAKLISTEKKKQITDAFDALKVKDIGGAANDITRVLGATVWNGSIEAVKRAVLAGADLTNAINAGIQYIRDNHKGTWNEKEYRDAISPAVEQMIPKEKVDASKIDESKINTPKLSGKKKRDFINQVVDAHNANRLTDAKFDQLYAKQLGAKELTAEDRQKVRELAKVISEVEQFEEQVKSDFTKENIAKYKTLLDKAHKANSDLQAYAQKPSNVWDTLISIMQGNLLTSLSLITNIYSNTALQPLRFFSTGIGSVIDYSVSTLAKTGLLSEMYKNPSIDLAELQKGYFKGAWNGAIEGAKQIATGPRGDERNLREINTQFSPVRAVSRWADGNRPLAQKINDYIEGTIGWPAEAMFRLLNAGDKPFRRAAETARAMELVKQKKLKGKDAEKFLMFPDPESAELIAKAGNDATFQQDNASSKFVQDMLSKLINAIGNVPVVGGPLKVLAKSQIPYVKTPWNIMVETMKYAAFPVTGAIGIHQIAKGNKRSGSVLVGQAIVGAMIFAVAKELFTKGLLTWDEPYDQKAGKQRERRQIQYDNIPPNSLNVSAIQRGLLDGNWEINDNDTWIDYNKLGVIGLLFDNYSNNYFSNIRDDQQMPEESEFYVDMLTTAPRVLSQSLDQSFLKGTNAFLTALQDGGGYQTEQWLINTSGALAAIVYPNTVGTISKSADEFMRDTRDDSFVEKLKNTYKTKFFIGDQLPAKVNLWGEKITGNPEGRDKYAFYLFDPTKFKNVDTDNFKYKLYQAWKESKFDDDYLPSIPKREISYRKVKIKLDAQQYEKLSIAIGEARENLASTYIASTGFDRKDKEKVIKKLKDLYEDGAERGKKKFLRDMGWNIMTPKKLSQIGKVD